MKDIVYKCLECNYEFIGNKDGLKCPKCNGHISPLRDATLQDEEEIERYKKISSAKQIKANDKSIVVLRMQSRCLSEDNIEVLEEKYTKKFGCKVVILEANLEMVDHI